MRDRIIADLNKLYPGRGFLPFDSKWTTHSLRKTARSLLSRAGVTSEIAEKCLGHVVGGVEGLYDHHSYATEKRIAFEALAREIDRIRAGRVDNVLAFAAKS